jgi:hypothetical protein
MVSLSLCLNDSVISIEPSAKPPHKFTIISNVCDSITSIEPITIIHLDKSIEACVGGEWVQLENIPSL